MIIFRAIFVLGLLLSSSAHAQNSEDNFNHDICEPSKKIEISYLPPMESIVTALKDFQASTASELTDAQYHASVAIAIYAGSDGSPWNISMDKSSGNKDVDRALISWARDIRFAGSCHPVVIPLMLN